MEKKTCKDCIYAITKNGYMVYCDMAKWIMHMESPACVEYDEKEGE